MSFPDRVNVTCPPLLEDELLVSLAKKYKKTAAQLALRFNVQRGVVVIPKSFSPPRIRENFQVGFTPSAVSFKKKKIKKNDPESRTAPSAQIFDFCISEEDMKAIEGLNKNIRFVELLM